MAFSEHEQDSLLLQKVIQDGCMQSFVTIYRKYLPNVSALILKTDRTAEDVPQIVFLRLLEGKCKYDGKSGVRAYLNGMALMILKEQNRSLSRMKSRQSKIREVREQIACGDRVRCPVDILSAKEQGEQQENAILDLPPKSRQAIKLVYQDGIPAAEAAKLTRCDFGAFRQRLKYGRQCLSKKLNTAPDSEDIREYKRADSMSEEPEM